MERTIEEFHPKSLAETIDTESQKLMISTIIGDINDKIGCVRSEYQLDNEKEIIDNVIGRMPVYKQLESYVSNTKSIGELLLSSNNLSEYISAVEKFKKHQEEIPLKELISEKVTSLSDSKSNPNEIRVRQLLENIVDILLQMEKLNLVIVCVLKQIYNYLENNNNLV